MSSEFKCEKCKKILSSAITLKYHQKFHSLKNFRCKFCLKFFNQKISLFTHIQRVHQTKDENVAKFPQDNENEIIGSQIPITKSQSVARRKSFVGTLKTAENKNIKECIEVPLISTEKFVADFKCCLCYESFKKKKKLRIHELFECG